MLPDEFLQRLRWIVPIQHYDAIIKTFSQPSHVAFRMNTLKAEKEHVLAELKAQGIVIKPVHGLDNAFLINPQQKSQLTQSDPHQRGAIYLQNLSSMLVPLVLDPQPQEEILDLTAAPGSKTTQIAALINNQGRVAAVEKSKNRFFKLKQTIAQQNAHCVVPYHKDGRLIWKQCPERFDRVLLDAPCSSEARFNSQQPESYSFWSEKKIKEMARNQWSLLNSALLALKPGGILVYSTCSFAPEENEAQINRLIKKFANKINVVPIEIPFSNTQPGLTQWENKIYHPDVAHCLRILPNENMSGFFICKIVKIRS